MAAVLECPALAHVPAVYYYGQEGDTGGHLRGLADRWPGRFFIV